jgi:hypothetical protein
MNGPSQRLPIPSFVDTSIDVRQTNKRKNLLT